MDVASLCSTLVQIRSENPPGKTRDIIEYIRGFLDSLGLRSSAVSAGGGRCNLVAVEPDCRFLLCGHVDVVPALKAGWTHDPFSGEVAEGYVRGRGSTDMKGGCAAMLCAYRDLLNQGIEPKAGFAFVCDEETGGEHGMRHLLAKNTLSPCDALIAEPTPPLSPCIGQKGMCRLEVTFSGVPGHSSLYPAMGVSAIMEAYSLLRHLNEIHNIDVPVDESLKEVISTSSRVLEEIFGREGLGDVLTRVMFNPGRIEGGEKANIVAQRCRLELDLRVPWGCTTGRLIRLIRDRAPNAKMNVMNAFEPNLTLPDARITAVVCREIARVYGSPAVPIVQWAASDARYLRSAGFDVVDYGPGEITTLHGIDERVSIENLEKAVDVYRGVIRTYSR